MLVGERGRRVTGEWEWEWVTGGGGGGSGDKIGVATSDGRCRASVTSKIR